MNLQKFDGFCKGVIVDANDPAGLRRVKVRILSLDGPNSKNSSDLSDGSPRFIRTEDEDLMWAEVCFPYDNLYSPQINQVVLIGFFSGYVESPVVLGWLGYDYAIEEIN